MRKQNSSPPRRACSSRGLMSWPLLREQVVGADLFAQQVRDALDDAIADGMTERVVVPLESGDIDETDRAPAPALLEREERFQLLGEAAEIHQLRLRIAVRLVGEIRDELLEVARDAVDRGVLGLAVRG